MSSYPFLDEKIEVQRSCRESSRWPEWLIQRQDEWRIWGHPGDGERLGGGWALGDEARDTSWGHTLQGVVCYKRKLGLYLDVGKILKGEGT